VNVTQEMISSAKVHAAFGPHNSGESLAVTPIMAKAKLPDLHSGVVNALIDPVKFPNAFRLAPSNTQWDDAVRLYCLKILKAKAVAITGDATGYGTSAIQASLASFKADGANVVFENPIDPAQPDPTPDLLRMRSAGAEAIVLWTVSAGMAARVMNARAAIGWDVPIVGHPSLGTGDIANLVSKPENWRKVYMVGYRSCSFGTNGRLPPKTEEFVNRVKGKVNLSDTSLWWVLLAVDGINLIAEAVEKSGSSASDAIIGYLNTVTNYDGLFGRYTYTKQEHNGFPTNDVVMSEANSQRDGAYTIAPGYT
jgi:branched-chain amino acid transport system substrate-binding protein